MQKAKMRPRVTGINLTQFCRNDPVNNTDPLGLATKVYSDDGNTLILISGGWVIGKYQKDASGNWCQLRGVGGGLDTSAISLGDVGMMTSEGAHGMVMAPVNLVVGGYNLVSGIGTYSGNLSVDAAGTWNQTVNVVQALPGAVPGMLEQVASDPKAIGGVAGDVMLGFGIAKVAQAGKLAQLSKTATVAENRTYALVGLVKPPKTPIGSSDVKKYLLDVVDSPEFASTLSRYNKGAETLGLRRTSDIADIRQALLNETTFHKTGNNLSAALFQQGEHAANSRFLLQMNPQGIGVTTAARTAEHELLHLGAALKGQGDTLIHDLLVHTVATPEVLYGGGSVVFVTAGGVTYAVMK